MTMIFEHLEDSLDCIQALVNACRPYGARRSIDGWYEVTTWD